MHNPATLLAKLSHSVSRQAKSQSLHWSAFILLTLGLAAGWAQNVRAASPETAPPQLKATLAQIDAAANRQDIQSVMQFYNANFKNSDGLTRASMEQALAKLWEQYPQLTYRTELKDWQTQGNSIVAETVTYIMGNQQANGTPMKLESTVRSRQRFDNQTIVGQEILSERTQLTSGTNPPDVQVLLPEQVRIGQQFNFDVIVKQPLGDDLLLGTALEEPIKPELYTKPTNFELELLPAGGIFKQGKAPLKPENHWVSAVLVRGDGMTMITQRLQVVDRLSTSTR